MPELESLGEIVETIQEEITSRKNGDNFKFATGLQDIDNVINAIRKKRLYVVGGRTSIGKTSLMCNFAFNLADKHAKVFFFSLEMSKEEIVQRFVCMGTGITYGLFELDYLVKELELGFDSFKKIIEDYNMIVVDSFGYHFNDLANFIKALAPKPDVIFIDHIQMASSIGYKSKYEAMSEYIRKLKELAMTEDIAIVVASQINRTAGEDRPKASQLKESGTIEETADCIFLCYWPYLYGTSEDKNEYYILIAKNRFGRVKPNEGVRVDFQPAAYKFNNYYLQQ